MAYQQSPGISWTEIDLTTIVPGPSLSVGAFAGDFAWGPINQPFSLDSEINQVRYFYTPTSTNFVHWFTVANFLQYSSQIFVVRAANTATAKNATSGSRTTLIKNDYDYHTNYADLSSNDYCGMFSAKYAGVLGNSIRVSVCASNTSGEFSTWAYGQYFTSAPGTSRWASDRGGSNDELHVIVIDKDGKFTGVPGTVLERFPFMSKASDAMNDDGTSNYYVNVLGDRSEYVYVVNHANTVTANVVSITVAGGGAAGAYPNDTWANNISLSGGVGTGATANVLSNSTGQISTVAIYNAGTNYLLDDNLILTVPNANPGFATATFTVGMGRVNTHAQSWGSVSTNTAFGQPIAVMTYGLSGGVDGSPTDGDIMDGYELMGDPEAYDISLVLTANHSSAVCQYINDTLVGGSNFSSVGRRDCVAFFSPTQANVVNNAGNEAADCVTRRNLFNSSSYVVFDSGWKKMYDKYNNVYRWVPLNGDIAGLCARTSFERDDWWSPAGFNRGHIKGVVQLGWSPSKADRDTLYKNGINPVVNFRGEGPVLYGDKTMLTKPSAFDKINVRRLFIALEKGIVKAAKYSLFEFNDEFTRAQFVALVEPFLRDVKGRRGIYDFKVVCDETNNTPVRIDRNEFWGDIYIKPARSINFIQLNFVAVGTGVSFSEVVGKF